jgi:hypothetical protein
MSVEVLCMPPPPRMTDSKRYSYMWGVTEFSAFMMDIADDSTSLMIRDDLCANMRPWWYYCERDDPNFFKGPPPPTEEELEAAEEAAAAAAAIAALAPPPEPAGFSLDESEGASQARQRECEAWLAVPRNKRKPYTLSGLLNKGSCMIKDNSIVIKGLPHECKTFYGDLREFLAEFGTIVDVYKPAKGPLFVGVLESKHVTAILNAMPNGLLYRGCTLTFERAMSRSKTSNEMATGVSV